MAIFSRESSWRSPVFDQCLTRHTIVLLWVGISQATTPIPTTTVELVVYNFVGKGDCQNTAGVYPRFYWNDTAFSMISGCRDLCTTLSAACVGYAFALSGKHPGYCYVYGNTLPDKGTGAAAPGKPLDVWSFIPGNGGSDTLTGGNEVTGWECHAKQPGVSGMHALSSCPPHPVPSSHAPSPCRAPHLVLAR